MEAEKRLRGVVWPDSVVDNGGNQGPERVAEAKGGRAGQGRHRAGSGQRPLFLVHLAGSLGRSGFFPVSA